MHTLSSDFISRHSSTLNKAKITARLFICDFTHSKWMRFIYF